MQYIIHQALQEKRRFKFIVFLFIYLVCAIWLSIVGNVVIFDTCIIVHTLTPWKYMILIKNNKCNKTKRRWVNKRM